MVEDYLISSVDSDRWSGFWLTVAEPEGLNDQIVMRTLFKDNRK